MTLAHDSKGQKPALATNGPTVRVTAAVQVSRRHIVKPVLGELEAVGNGGPGQLSPSPPLIVHHFDRPIEDVRDEHLECHNASGPRAAVQKGAYLLSRQIQGQAHLPHKQAKAFRQDNLQSFFGFIRCLEWLSYII